MSKELSLKSICIKYAIHIELGNLFSNIFFKRLNKFLVKIHTRIFSLIISLIMHYQMHTLRDTARQNTMHIYFNHYKNLSWYSKQLTVSGMNHLNTYKTSGSISVIVLSP